jgi:hypothetical protein
MAQGANRRERGISLRRAGPQARWRDGLAARHRLIQLAGVGHAASDVLAAPQTRELVFG